MGRDMEGNGRGVNEEHMSVGTEENHYNLNQGNWYSSQDSNRLPSERKS
jgi:hypothetical protein